jgi:hypothetical protein
MGSIAIYIAFAFISSSADWLCADEPSASRETEPSADWIPVGSVPPPVVRSAVEARARIESRSIEMQRYALSLIRDDMNEYGVAPLRIAAVPILVDLLGYEYRILEVPFDYTIDATIRIDAIVLLSELGGAPATDQIRETIVRDDDESVRVVAARSLARSPSDDPDRDLAVIARALRRAADLGRESEVAQLLTAARIVRERTWNPGNRDLIESLVGIAGGSYSASIRNRAVELLEELAER